MEKPSYFAILTADVRYDKTLKPLARLLYAEITALCNKEGHCWAGNQYFADLYEVDKNTVSGWIGQLKTRGYITVQLEYKEGTKQILHRHIRINGEGIHKIIDTSLQKDGYPINEIIEVNKTINNTVNNTVNNKDYFSQFWDFYPRKAGKESARKAWNKLQPNEELMALIANNIQERIDKGEWRKDNKSYILHASTFLNQKRWEDEVLEKQHEKSKSTDTAGSKWLNLEADF
ncbi:MAG: helix-turn-helix domain-containing protein [bacterium]|nr:helix-turn-helix domain-containing protein [bacterium]